MPRYPTPHTCPHNTQRSQRPNIPQIPTLHLSLCIGDIKVLSINQKKITMNITTKIFNLPSEGGTFYYLLKSYKEKRVNGDLSEEIGVSFTGDYSNLNWFTTSLIEVTDEETANQLGVTELGYYVKAVCQESNISSERKASNKFIQSESGNMIWVDFIQAAGTKNIVLNVQTLLASNVDRCFVWVGYEDGTGDDTTKDLTYDIQSKYTYSPWSTADEGAVVDPNIQYKDEAWVADRPGIKIPSNTYVIVADFNYPTPQTIVSIDINFFDRSDTMTIVNPLDRYPQISRRVNWSLFVE